MINYDIYRQQILNFLQTVSIKCSMFAPMYKRRAEEKGFVVRSDYENPYYLNLCGIYHSINKPVLVTTVEDNTEVLFANKDQGLDSEYLGLDSNDPDYGKVIDFGFNKYKTLKDYPKSFGIYKIPNEEYKTLCLRNPTETGLIKSILYPCKDIETAINARDLTVLSCDSSLLEENERYSLLEAMNNFLDHIYNRWYIKDYDYEDTYPLAFMGIIYALLPQVLLTQRLLNLRTDNVHSLHIWEYLASKGLGEYESILSNKQARFLYKNINYIYRNKGKKSNIEILAENLLRDLHVTLVGKTIAQESSNALLSCTTVPEFLNDDIIINGTNEQIDESTKETMENILSRMYNEGYYPDFNKKIDLTTTNSDYMEDKFSRANTNVLDTRLLEFKKAILNTRYLNLFSEFLMDTLLYHISENKLDYEIKFTDTNTNMVVNLNIRDALVLLHYAHFRELSGNDTITYYNDEERYVTILDPDTLEERHIKVGKLKLDPAKREITPFKYSIRIPYKNKKPDNLPATFYRYGTTWNINSLINTEKLLSDIRFDSGPFTSVNEFLDLIAEQFPAMVTHIRDVRQSSHSRYQFAMVYYYYYLVENKTIEVNLTPHKTYEEWIVHTPGVYELLNAYEDMPDSDEYFKLLCTELWNNIFPISEDRRFDEFTGVDRDNTPVYNGLKKLFTQLCSYRLFFLETSRDNNTFITAPYQACETIDAYEENIDSLNTNIDYSTTLIEEFTTSLTNYSSDNFKHSYFEEYAETNISTDNKLNFTDLEEVFTDYMLDNTSYYGFELPITDTSSHKLHTGVSLKLQDIITTME